VTKCAALFRASSLTDEHFTLVYSFDLAVQTDMNFFILDFKMPLLQAGCFFKIRSNDTTFKRSIVLDTSDMANYADTLSTGTLVKQDSAIKLEYTLEKYLTDYKCSSDIKRFSQAGIFPVYFFTPDSFTYMTSVNVTDRKQTLFEHFILQIFRLQDFDIRNLTEYRIFCVQFTFPLYRTVFW